MQGESFYMLGKAYFDSDVTQKDIYHMSFMQIDVL